MGATFGSPFAGAGAGGLTPFCYVQIIHIDEDTVVTVQFNQVPSSIDSTGWSAEINGVPTTMTFLSITGKIAKFTIGATILGDVVTVSYDGAGNTLFEGEQLCTFTDVVASNEPTGDIRWVAAASLFMATDSTSNSTNDDHLKIGRASCRERV